MSELLMVEINENQEQIISGRLLHTFLRVGTEYMKWFERKCEYDFTEKIDYEIHFYNSDFSEVNFDDAAKMSPNQRSARGIFVDHKLKLDMAKEICMLEKNERGKQARQYFIQLEKDWNSPEKTMARALGSCAS